MWLATLCVPQVLDSNPGPETDYSQAFRGSIQAYKTEPQIRPRPLPSDSFITKHLRIRRDPVLATNSVAKYATKYIV